MPPVADRVAPDDELRRRVVAHLIESTHRAEPGRDDRRSHRVHHDLRGRAWLGGPADHLSHLHGLIERALDARRQRDLARLEHIRDPLLVGPHVEVAHTEVDHDDVATLDDAVVGGRLDPVRPGDIDAGDLERGAESPLELLLLDPPRDVGECGDAGRDDLVRQRTLSDLAPDLGRIAERNELAHDASRAEVRHHLLGGDQSRCVRRTEGRDDLGMQRVREAVGHAHLVRHVEPDPTRVPLAHERAQIGTRQLEVIGAARGAIVIGDVDRDPFNAIAAAVGEDVVARGADVATTEELPEWVVVPLAHGHDPHVDAVLAHRLGEDAVELLAPHLTEAGPAIAGFEVGLRESRRGRRECGHEAECCEQRAAHWGGVRAFGRYCAR